jgi:hypothetical protein
LKVTIGSPINKVVLNVISSSKKPCHKWIIVACSMNGLTCFLCVIWDLHFETQKHEAPKCETFTRMSSKNHDHVHCATENKHEDGCMQNFKHMEDFGNTWRSKCFKLFEGASLSCMLWRKEICSWSMFFPY